MYLIIILSLLSKVNWPNLWLPYNMKAESDILESILTLLKHKDCHVALLSLMTLEVVILQCHRWWQPPVPSMITKLPTWQLLVFNDYILKPTVTTPTVSHPWNYFVKINRNGDLYHKTAIHKYVYCEFKVLYIGGLVQERCNFSALAMELHLSCTNPSIYSIVFIVLLDKHCIILGSVLMGLCT